MQIRRAEAPDEPALAEIRRNAILALAVPALPMEQAIGWAAGAATDRVARAIDEHEVWVAVDGAAIGWVEVHGNRVAALYVAPARARQGVGTALIEHAEASIRACGWTTAVLESSLNALGFYLRRGYSRCGPPGSDGAFPLGKRLAHDAEG